MPRLFDVVVIGSGPGGQIAAIRASQLGFRTACIDEWTNANGGPAAGGTCTNIGCIPAKALLQSTENFERVGHHYAEHGINVSGLEMDVPKMISRKGAVVRQNNDGILFLYRKNKIDFFHGRATFLRKIDYGYELGVSGLQETVVGRHIVLATGSLPRPLPLAPFDEVRILSNDGALRMTEVPKRLGVIGAGVVGLELASVWRRLGAQVTVLEGLTTFLPSIDEQISKEARRLLGKQGLKLELGVTIGQISSSGEGVDVAFTDSKGERQDFEFDKLLISIGRVPNTTGLGCASVGLELDLRGAVVVDEDCRTNLPGVWAIGDVVRGPMLAHKAEEEGSAVAERIAGQRPEVDFNTIPSVIYTSPEIAWVGKNEQQLKSAGTDYKIGIFPFMANGRARAMGDTTGFAKVIVDASTGQILGVHIIGPSASELIAEAVTAMEFRASNEDIARVCHAHPTLSEVLKEASLAVDRRALNI